MAGGWSPCESASELPSGAWASEVRARREWDEVARVFRDQVIDPETGFGVWTVTCQNVAVMQAAPLVTKSGGQFRPSPLLKVSVISRAEPVIPTEVVNGFAGLVQFERLHDGRGDGGGDSSYHEGGQALASREIVAVLALAMLLRRLRKRYNLALILGAIFGVIFSSIFGP